VARNATTFVPIGRNVALWGVKSRLEHGQVIREDGEAGQLGEPNAAQASRNPEAATEEPEPAAALVRGRARGISEEAANETTKQMAELQGRYPGCAHSRRRKSACDSLQGDGQVRIVRMDSPGHKRTLMDADMVTDLHLC
jgi:hypothetical protein